MLVFERLESSKTAAKRLDLGVDTSVQIFVLGLGSDVACPKRTT
jgi:hypothetical protein